MLHTQRAFTLIEFIAVLALIALFGFYAGSRLSDNRSNDIAARDQLAAALSLGQQLAFARESASNPIEFSIVNSTALNLTENGLSVYSHGLKFPLSDFGAVAFTASPATIRFNKLGEVEAEVTTQQGNTWQPIANDIRFSIRNGSATLTLCLNPSGLSYAC